ncbi:hypothetical protein [Streptomyces sp. NPDC048187]|uniref:hypothetical protein n=1 Tax=Streptomyces sp. NPDC048187 TaxID=3365509 RepID=UPI003724058F
MPIRTAPAEQETDPGSPTGNDVLAAPERRRKLPPGHAPHGRATARRQGTER